MSNRDVKKSKDSMNHQKSAWYNESNEQLSLEQGSAAYEEYVDDRKSAAPSAPDDEFHQKLEEHDVQVRNKMSGRNKEEKDETVEERKYRLQQMKRGMVGGIAKAAGKFVTEMEKEAAKTPSDSDDKEAKAVRKRVSDIRFDREPATGAIYDDGVSADKEDVDDEILPSWMEKYV